MGSSKEVTQDRAMTAVLLLDEAGGCADAEDLTPGLSPQQAARALQLARRAGLVRPDGGQVALTSTGRAAARVLGRGRPM